MEQKDRIILKTAAAMFVLLLFFCTQGSIVVITGIEGVPSAMIRGAVIWSLVAVTLAYFVYLLRMTAGKAKGKTNRWKRRFTWGIVRVRRNREVSPRKHILPLPL